jgi:hypothetical protein
MTWWSDDEAMRLLHAAGALDWHTSIGFTEIA